MNIISLSTSPQQQHCNSHVFIIINIKRRHREPLPIELLHMQELVRELHRDCGRVPQSIADNSETVRDPTLIFCMSVYNIWTSS